MIKKWLTETADRSFAFLAAILMRRAVAPLVHIDHAALRDAGLTRAAIADFLSMPLGTDPGEFFTQHQRQAFTEFAAAGAPPWPVAPEPRLDNQRDARDGPKPRRRRRRRNLSSKSTLNLAKEIP